MHPNQPHINKPSVYKEERPSLNGSAFYLAAKNIVQADRLPVTKCMMNEMTAKMMSR
jgi:hypothetical protein